jgi:hypothetical protein
MVEELAVLSGADVHCAEKVSSLLNHYTRHAA